MNMLDIGVGGGRTTKYFFPLAKEYVGIDYSPEMIQACKKKFPELRFEVADVRNLSLFGDGHFDFTCLATTV
jgi:ubiquinone/menaquinone biosynthesis C-methylase UbiE